MKFMSFKNNQKVKVGVLLKNEQYVVDINDLNLSKNYDDMLDLIENISDKDIEIIKSFNFNKNNVKTYSLDCLDICAPIIKPKHDIICVGVNYQEHLNETKNSFKKGEFIEPKKVVYFSKRVVEAIGNDDYIENDNFTDELDYEVELAVIIGKKGKNISKEEVKDYIFGYTIMNDISARDLQQQHLQWYRGKSLDTFTSLGPVIVHKEEIPFPIELDIYSKVNGEIRQKSNTKYLLSDIPSIISEISTGMTLEAGDIIATGTPSGVGMGFNPPKYMKSKDVVECGIEKIGILKNVVK